MGLYIGLCSDVSASSFQLPDRLGCKNAEIEIIQHQTAVPVQSAVSLPDELHDGECLHAKAHALPRMQLALQSCILHIYSTCCHWSTRLWQTHGHQDCSFLGMAQIDAQMCGLHTSSSMNTLDTSQNCPPEHTKCLIVASCYHCFLSSLRHELWLDTWHAHCTDTPLE